MLSKLNRAGIRFVPTLMAGGYVGEHATLVSLFWSVTKGSETNEDRKREAAQAEVVTKEHRARKRKFRASESEDFAYIRHYVHYRTVVKEVCLPLDIFPSSQELVSVVGDTITGAYVPFVVLLLGLKEYPQRMLMRSNCVKLSTEASAPATSSCVPGSFSAPTVFGS